MPTAYRRYEHREQTCRGSLSALVRGAAIDAILDGTEKITKATLTSSYSTEPPRNTRKTAPGKRSRRRRGVA